MHYILMEGWILDDSNFARDPITGDVSSDDFEKFFGPTGKYLGHAVCSQPYDQYTRINPTMPMGSVSGIWLSLNFQLKKWEYLGVYKAKEILEVTPTYAQYYQITLKQKEEIEAKIKDGLRSISQSISDLELVKHDERKYKEFLDYLHLEYDPETRTWNDSDPKIAKELKAKRDEHTIRAMFVDLVDAHTGESIAMRNIVSRWPTLITDFMRLTDEMIDVDEITKELNVTKAEGVVLATKNKLYNEWKKLFVPEIKSRYEKLSELIKSREFSIEQYRNWVKPHIARHKLVTEALEDSEGRKEFSSLFVWNPSQAMAYNKIITWAWRDYTAKEYFRAGGSEDVAIDSLDGGYGAIKPFDAWTLKNLIFHKEHGLITKYNWITEKWVKEMAKKALDSKMYIPRKLYYSFFQLVMEKSSIRLPSGEEFEDGDIFITTSFMSQNVLFCKILELFAQQNEFDNYVNDLLGLRHNRNIESKDIKKYHKETKGIEKFSNEIMEALGKFGLSVQALKPGPYEKDFFERISKVHLRGVAKDRYGPIVSFIKNKIGV